MNVTVTESNTEVTVNEVVTHIVTVTAQGPQGPAGAGADTILDGTDKFTLLAFDTSSPGTTSAAGECAWNTDEETLDINLGSSILQVGQEFHVNVRNNSGAPIANGAVLMYTGTLGASGRLTVGLFDGSDKANAKLIVGLATETIADGADGKATMFGKVRSVDTSSYSDGDILWADPDVHGALVNVKPVSSKLAIPIAAVINQHATNGTLMVRALTFDEHHVVADENVTASASATNYTPTASTVEGHLAGIDTALAVAGGGFEWTFTDSAPTTGNVTAVAGTWYRLDLSGLTADRNFVLPTCAAGDNPICIEVVTAAPAAYVLDFLGDTGVTLRGHGLSYTAAYFSGVFNAGDKVVFTPVDTNIWDVEIQFAKGSARIEGSTTQTLTLSTTDEVGMLQSTASNTGFTVTAGDASTPLASRITARRRGFVYVSGAVRINPANTGWWATWMYAGDYSAGGSGVDYHALEKNNNDRSMPRIFRDRLLLEKGDSVWLEAVVFVGNETLENSTASNLTINEVSW